MIPRLNSRKAASPAIGFSASAACCVLSMSVLPLAFSVAAVVSMMKKATRFDMAMPMPVSQPMRVSSRGACSGFSLSGPASSSPSSSSTSWELCQKKR